MFSFVKHSRFQKAYEKLIQKNKEVESRIEKTLDLMIENPRHPGLKTHKIVTKKNKTVRSSWVHGDLRIIWQFNKGEIQIIDLLDLGNHGQVY